MTSTQQIEALFPLVSYEEERARNGRITLLDETQRVLHPGVHYIKRTCLRGDRKPTALYITLIDPGAQAHLTISACPHGTIKHVRQHAQDHGGPVLFAMNAGFFHFFNDGDLTPYGIQVVDGVTLNEPGLPQNKVQFSSNFFCITKDGIPMIANTEDYHAGLKNDLRCAVGGGVRLIRDGCPCLHKEDSLAPRSAVGITKAGRIILLGCDGRSKVSSGLSFADLIDIFLQLDPDTTELLNLDGGGSTCVVLRNENGSFFVDNVPSGPPTPTQPAQEPYLDTQARPVADALLIIAD